MIETGSSEGRDMTKDKALDALNLFLNGDINLDALEDRVVPLTWNSESKTW